MIRGGLLILAGLVFSLSLSAQNSLSRNEIKIQGYSDWSEGVFVLDLTAPLVKDSNVLPVNRFRTETFLAENLKESMISALFTLRLDSQRTIQDLVAQDPGLLTPLGNLVGELTQSYSRTDPGYENLTVRYTLPLFSRLMGILVVHQQPERDFLPLGYGHQKDFTGLVVYVPSRDRAQKLVPALFPRIWDRNQDLVLETRNVDPLFLKKWGTMTYTRSFDEAPHRDRIGSDPLRIVAVGIQGESPTDLVISLQDADLIRYSEATRRRVSEGRILVIQGD